MPTYDGQPDDDEHCDQSSVSTCTTTFSVQERAVSPATVSALATTKTSSRCGTVTGCDITSSATSTTTSSCASPTGKVQKRAGCGTWKIVWSLSPGNLGRNNLIETTMTNLGIQFYASKSGRLGTLFWSVQSMTDDQYTNLGGPPSNVRFPKNFETVSRLQSSRSKIIFVS
jgi:hypothetical protein